MGFYAPGIRQPGKYAAFTSFLQAALERRMSSVLELRKWGVGSKEEKEKREKLEQRGAGGRR
jgi:hypothetical protein